MNYALLFIMDRTEIDLIFIFCYVYDKNLLNK